MSNALSQISTTPEPLLKQARSSDTLPILIAAGIFSALSVWMAIAGQGFLEADGITHYLARRFALDQPLHIVGVWSRPLCVLVYCIPAYFGGLIGTRLTSLALVIAMLLVTLAVARRQNLARPALVAIFLLTQPLLFAHSFSELTEVPFALLLIAAFWAYQRKWFLLLAILAALSPLARPEGFGLIVAIAIALLAHRRWWWLAILPAGVIGWCWIGWHVYGGPSEYPWWQWLGKNWPYSPDSMYGRGSPLWFVVILPAVVGSMAFPLVWIGAYRAFQIDATPASRTRKFFQDHDYRCRALIALIPLGILVIHSLLWTFGKMASNGEPRYMLIVSPFWAILAAGGWEWVCARLSIARPLRWTIVAALVPIVANLCYPAFPLGAQDDDRLARDVNDWLKTVPALRDRYPLMAGALPHLFIRWDVDRMDHSRIVDSSRTTVAHPPAGVMLVWDNIYSTHNSNIEYCIEEPDLLANGWRPIHEWTRGTHTPRRLVVYLSPLDKDRGSQSSRSREGAISSTDVSSVGFLLESKIKTGGTPVLLK